MRLTLALCALALATMTARADFALRDGDTVVFLGDSITAARGYTKTVELYTLMRYPERRVRFFNAGQGGDTASAAVARLDREVFRHHPTVVTVAFGINDIAWGAKADAAHQQAYLDGLRTIIAQCKAHGARPVICAAAVTDVPPDTAEHGFLQSMCDEGLALAKSLGADTVDTQRGLREIQRRVVAANEHESDPTKRTRLHVADGIHLNDLGHLAMGYVLLKGLGAPPDVSVAEIDAAHPAAAVTRGCRITDLHPRDDGSLEFTRLDEGLPINRGAFTALDHRFIPIPDGLDGYRLTVKNLPPGDYEITAGGRALGKQSAERLAAGVNLCSDTANPWEPGGPWDAQSVVVKGLVDARSALADGTAQREHFLASHPQSATLDADTERADDALTTLARATAKPYPYRFVLRRVEK